MPDCYDDIEENCDTCYETSIEECEDLIFTVGLTGTYNLNIVDKFSKIYTQEITASDSFEIDKDELPDGYFNKYAGAFELYLTNGSGFTVPLTIEEDEYNCIILKII
jgi:hypothetical protein